MRRQPSTIEKVRHFGAFRICRPAAQLILDEERHHMGEAHVFLFLIGEARHAFALDDRLALISDAMKDARRMADQGHRLAGVIEGP